MQRRYLQPWLGALAALFSGAALATAVPSPYSTLVSVGVDGSGFKSSTSFGQIFLDGTLGIATAQSGTGPAPFVSTEVTSVSDSKTVFARGNAQLLYSWMLVGPASSTPVPVTMTAQGSISLLGPTTLAFTHYTVGVFGQVLYEQRQCAGFQALGPDGQPCNTGTSDFSWKDDKTQFGATVGQDFFVALDVLAWAAQDGTALAAIDPVFEIDPSFPNASLYQIVFSAGITQDDPGGGGGGGGGGGTVGGTVPEAPPLALLTLAAWPLLRQRRRP